MSSKNIFNSHADEYEAWFLRYPFAYQSELAAIRALLPEKDNGVEIGVGSGLFASALNIRAGVDPSAVMLDKARARGIDAVRGVAESLPYHDDFFDFALLVTTVCFLDDIDLAFSEVNRVLKPSGSLLIAFVDKNSPVGISYQQKKQHSLFYRNATFYSVDDLIGHLKTAGFQIFHYAQTLYHLPADMRAIDPVRQGHGEGSFVVIKAEK